MEGITKAFPGVLANDKVNLELFAGEVHALLGENGAGKTTLMNILYGLYQPDAGTIYIDGKPRKVTDPKAAIAMGIGMVHQHFMLVPPFTAAENIILGGEPVAALGRLDMSTAVERVRELSDRYGLKVDPLMKVESMSVGMQQRVEIIKALYRGAEILILDEPTAVLTPQEVHELAQITNELASQGKTIVIITHKLKEVLSMTQSVTVIRRGCNAGRFDTASTTPQELAKAMVGRDVVLDIPKAPVKMGEIALEAIDIRAKGNRGLEVLKGVSLAVRHGEILGIAGVEGNGQSELVEVLTGLRRTVSGFVKVCHKNITGLGPRAFNLAGIAHIPEDRHKRGLILDFTIAENAVLNSYYEKPFSKAGLLNYPEIAKHGRRLVDEYDIRTPSELSFAKTLSGGNQQKLIIGRELIRHPEVIVAAQPTRGLDVGAIEFVHRQLLAARDSGKAVLLISLELDEILALADTVAVMYDGRIVATIPISDATEERLGLLMTGTDVCTREGGEVC